MRVKKNVDVYCCDFETTVYKGQTYTEVWAAVSVKLGEEDAIIHHTIGDWFNWMVEKKKSLKLYFHNLKFDGHFIISYLIRETRYVEAWVYNNDNDHLDVRWLSEKEMGKGTFKYAISEMGQWYSIRIRTKYGYQIEILDSLKLLPFSLARIGKSFDTKHKKLTMEYEGFRYAGCDITPEEMDYIKNDGYVLAEALKIMYDEGHTKMTIGSCCLSEYKLLCYDYDNLYPNLYEVPLDGSIYEAPNAGLYVRKAYGGGWCYLVPGKALKRFNRGVTADVNSLYPSVMSGASGNKYPIGLPHFWSGNYIPDEAKGNDKLYFVRIRTRFYIKKNMLPFVQIKGTKYYKGTEMLITSDVYDRVSGEYQPYYLDRDGIKQEAIVTKTLTEMDFQLLQEHYDLYDFEILDGCWFKAQTGLFDAYIDKYALLKQTSKGARRELAKLFLNNLYGKFSSNTDSSFKVAFQYPDGSLGFHIVTENEKTPGYIPVGACVTSYARNFTIRAAQKNFYGEDKPGFIYADTDSIHCDLLPEQVKGITVDPVKFLCWKLESTWDIGWFVRQKTYIEHVVQQDLQDCSPYYNIKCAGMTQTCKDLWLKSIDKDYTVTDEDRKKLTDRQISFIEKKRAIEDFKVGLVIPDGKLRPTAYPGGVVLEQGDYSMRNVRW